MATARTKARMATARTTARMATARTKARMGKVQDKAKAMDIGTILGIAPHFVEIKLLMAELATMAKMLALLALLAYGAATVAATCASPHVEIHFRQQLAVLRVPFVRSASRVAHQAHQG